MSCPNQNFTEKLSKESEISLSELRTTNDFQVASLELIAPDTKNVPTVKNKQTTITTEQQIKQKNRPETKKNNWKINSLK